MKIKVMNAHIGDQKDLNRKDFIFEPKLDGYRALCYVNESIQLFSRNEINLTFSYPELLNFRKNIKAKSCILDGEIVAYDKNGKPNFELLQQGYPASYIVFDILVKDGEQLINLPLMERKKILDKTVVNGNNLEKIFYTTEGEKLWREMKKLGMQGVMAKNIDSKYYPGRRTRIWLKIKFFNTIDCIIIGYTTGRRIISSLLLGLYDKDKNLRFIGEVGTGFSLKFLDFLLEKFNKIKLEQKIIKDTVKIKNVHWLKPKLVSEIKYVEITRDKKLRSPVFVRLRNDKKPKECTFEEQTK